MAGAIGSGKTFVASCFAQFGWRVISSDDLSRQAYLEPETARQLQAWWGDAVFKDGVVDRSAIAKLIFNSKPQREKLEALIHPTVARIRETMMAAGLDDPTVAGFVWDSPLLFETGLNRQCDWIVFVDAPLKLRQRRVLIHRGWSAEELERREISQLPLDIKRKMSQDVISNAEDASPACDQVQKLLSHLSARLNLRTIR